MTNTWVVGGHVGIKADNPDYAAMTVSARSSAEASPRASSTRSAPSADSRTPRAEARGPTSRARVSSSATRARAATRPSWRSTSSRRRSAAHHGAGQRTRSSISAKNAILNSYVFQYASKGQIAARMAYLDFFGYPADFTAKYPEEVKKVTAESILAAAKRNIHPDDLQVLVVGDQKDFAQPLASLGEVQTSISRSRIPRRRSRSRRDPRDAGRGQEAPRRVRRRRRGAARTGRRSRASRRRSTWLSRSRGCLSNIGVRSVRTADGR